MPSSFLEPLQENVDLVANLQRLGIFKFVQRNDTLGFISDIDEHFAWTNFQNLPFDDASFPKSGIGFDITSCIES